MENGNKPRRAWKAANPSDQATQSKAAPITVESKGKMDQYAESVASEKVALVGASVRWAAQSAKRAGFSVFGLDLFGDQDTRAICDHFQILRPDLAISSQIGPLLGEKPTSAVVENRQNESPRKPERAPPGRILYVGDIRGDALSPPQPPSLQYLREMAASTGFGFPESIPLFGGPMSGGLTPDDSVSKPTSGRWLRKSFDGTGGLEVVRATADTTESPTSNMSRHYWQRWIPGKSYGLVALATARQTSLLGLSRSLFVSSGDCPYVYAGSCGPVTGSGIPWDSMQRLASLVADRCNVRGLFNLDLIRGTDGQWWLLELNARPSASCEVLERHAHATGQLAKHDSLMRIHLDAICGQSTISKCMPTCDQVTMNWRLANKTPSSPAQANVPQQLKRIVYARKPGRFNQQALDRIEIAIQASTHPIQIADVPCNDKKIERGHPILTLLTSWRTDESWEQAKALRHAIREVQTSVVES